MPGKLTKQSTASATGDQHVGTLPVDSATRCYHYKVTEIIKFHKSGLHICRVPVFGSCSGPQDVHEESAHPRPEKSLEKKITN